jgi:hypothetical protein
MPAGYFNNNTNQIKFIDSIIFNGIKYNYTIYLYNPTKITNPEKQEIINYFGNRIYRGGPCLGLGTEYFKELIRGKDISAFFKVQVDGMNNVASGTLQIYDWCDPKNPNPSTDNTDVWISDVCKIASPDVVDREKAIKGSTGFPVEAMFFLMEQLAIQNLQKTQIKLLVENKPDNATFLIPRYTAIGFNVDDICTQTMFDHTNFEIQTENEEILQQNIYIDQQNAIITQENDVRQQNGQPLKDLIPKKSPQALLSDPEYIVMTKTGITEDKSTVDFSFLISYGNTRKRRRIITGGKRSKKRTNKGRTSKKRSNRRNSYYKRKY